ncbi:MAG: hypothetical protein SPJ34_05585 [Candidatus Ornithospirochaeta sp.]|nr:hypothetical protein [Candidatus Ornithospirochaeta sp.]
MKKTLLALLIVAAAAMPFAFAQVDAIVSIKPFYTGSNIPASGFQKDNSWSNASGDAFWNDLHNSWWMKRQDYWMLAYEKTSFMDLGLEVKTRNFNLVTRLDLMQDVLVNLMDYSSLSTNLPFVGNLIDLTLPRVGFADYTTSDGSFFVSAGRRLIKWGPGTYDLAVGDSQPYLDNIWAEYETAIGGSWDFSYNFIAVFPKLWMTYGSPSPVVSQKAFFGHKWSFSSDYLRISIGELNNVYDKNPTFFDASPFVIWHDNNQDDYSNVFLHLALEGKIGPVRAFGTFAMDDFDLPHETGSDKPMAIGFSAGIEYHVLDGKAIEDFAFDRRDYTIKEDTFRIDNGLNVGFEFYHTSPLLYNRKSTSGKFTVPFQFISLAGDRYNYYEDAYFLGFKYGPDAELFRLYGEYTDYPFEASLAAELLRRGQYGIESKYGDRSAIDSHMPSLIALAGDVNTALLIDAGFAYYFQPSFKVQAGFGWQQDFTNNKGAYSVSIGVCLDPVATDWKNLFR